MTIKNPDLYLAVRLNPDEGYEWADPTTASGVPEVTQSRAKDKDKLIPQWAKANPVQRIAKFTLTEDTE